jgi:hypothetical protein
LIVKSRQPALRCQSAELLEVAWLERPIPVSTSVRVRFVIVQLCAKSVISIPTSELVIVVSEIVTVPLPRWLKITIPFPSIERETWPVPQLVALRAELVQLPAASSPLHVISMSKVVEVTFATSIEARS